MVHTHDTLLLQERFEPAKALRGAMRGLVWRRRCWVALAAVAVSLAAVAVAFTLFAILYAARHTLTPAAIVVAVPIALFAAAFLLLIAVVVGTRWWWCESFNRAAADADALLGSDAIRNALDLAKLRDDEPFVSPTFAKVAIEQAWERWQTAARNGAVRQLTQSHCHRALVAASVAVPLLIVAFAAARWSDVSVTAVIALYRDAHAVLAFERSGKLHLQVSDTVVLKGTQVTAIAQAEGGKATSVRLRWRTVAGERWLPMTSVGDNRFAASLTVTDSGTLQAVCGRIKSAAISVRAATLPKVTEWLVTLEPPDYTGLPSESFTADAANLRVLKGTQVSVIATASAPLQQARCLASPLPSFALQTGERQVHLRFTALRPFQWQLRLRDRDGFEGTTPRYRVTVLPDRPPQVSIATSVSIAMAGGFVPLVVRAQDDFGVSALALQIGVNDARTPPSRPQTVPLAMAMGKEVERSVAIPVPVDAAGKCLWLRGVAKDNDTVSGAKTTFSQWLTVRIGTPEELVGTPEAWRQRLGQLESWLQKGEWQKAQAQVAQWQRWWQEQWQQAQWANQPLPLAWLAQWLRHLQTHLQQGDGVAARNELWQMQRALERAIGEQRLAELAQEASRLRAMQESVVRRLQHHASPSSLAPTQKVVAESTEQLRQALRNEVERWAKLGEADVAFQLRDAAEVLERRPTTAAQQQAAAAMRDEQGALAQLHASDALADLRDVEERLTSPTQNPLAQLYRQERNLLAQLLEQTERLRRDQMAVRQVTERVTQSERSMPDAPERAQRERFAPPTPPSWQEVERLTGQTPMQRPLTTPQDLAGHQQQLRQRAEGLRHPLRAVMERTPQLSPEAPHHLQDAIERMRQAEADLRLMNLRQAAPAQRRAEQALQQLSEALRRALQTEQGSTAQRMGAGENEAMALARRQAQLLRQTQRLHQQRQQGQMPSPAQLQGLGAEEGNIRRALSRMEGFFGETLPPELRQRLGDAQEQLRWLENQLPQGETGQPAQERQRQVLATLFALAQALSGQQRGHQQGQQHQQAQGQKPALPDLNWGRFVEHGPPLRQVPEALRGAKGGAAFVEPSRSPATNVPPIFVPRITVPPAYRDAVQKYQRQVR